MALRLLDQAAAIGWKPRTETSVEPSGCDEHPDRPAERVACAQSFRHFLHHWMFKNEAGVVQTFASLWSGQSNAVEAMRDHAWLYLLKAGKLGFTELECAYDGWVALYRHPNARVHLFSLDGGAAKALIKQVRFGLVHLPDWLGLSLLDGPGGDTTTSLTLDGGVDDQRVIMSYPATTDAAIDQTAHHSHVDELARMPWPDQTWASIESTVAPGGSVHIVSRGAGDQNFGRELWYEAVNGASPLHPHFEAWDQRPRVPAGKVPEGADPNEVFYAEKEGMGEHQRNWFLPRTAEDALSGSGEDAFVDVAHWLGCIDESLPELLPGSKVPGVLALDAGVSDDYFAAVLVTRHPRHHDQIAVRAVRVWKPPPGGAEIEQDPIEQWIRTICLGGCVTGLHPNARAGTPQPDPSCEQCAAENRVESYNITQIAYDAYQLVGLAQRLTKDHVTWCRKFGQGEERALADHSLKLMMIGRTVSHGGQSELTEAVRNAKAKVNAGEENKLRIIKANPSAKVDALVALSMGASECLRLNLPQVAE